MIMITIKPWQWQWYNSASSGVSGIGSVNGDAGSVSAKGDESPF
jgi:hypothetical protein